MPTPTPERLAALPHLSKAALCDLWKEIFRTVPPAQLRRDVMIPILGYRIQEQAFGSLRPDSLKRLRQLARTFEANPKAGCSSTPRFKPGTRLVRQWQGQVHVVQVEERGYEYKGARYRSLSEIARLITGTRWSGPAFFGIKGKQARKSREAA